LPLGKATIVRDPLFDRQAARAEGRRRAQTVTTWTAGGSLLVAALLAGVLAHGTAAARSAASTDEQSTRNQTTQNQTNSGQLQAPDNPPALGDQGGVDAGTGGS
jgi:hypothetical protein